MAASAAALKYEQLHKRAVGGDWLTVTKIEINGEAEEYKKGGIAVNAGIGGLGLPDAILKAAWLTGPFTDSKFEKAFDNVIQGGKLILFATGAEKKYAAELEEAEGKALAKYNGVVVAVGR